MIRVRTICNQSLKYLLEELNIPETNESVTITKKYINKINRKLDHLREIPSCKICKTQSVELLNDGSNSNLHKIKEISHECSNCIENQNNVYITYDGINSGKDVRQDAYDILSKLVKLYKNKISQVDEHAQKCFQCRKKNLEFLLHLLDLNLKTRLAENFDWIIPYLKCLNNMVYDCEIEINYGVNIESKGKKNFKEFIKTIINLIYLELINPKNQTYYDLIKERLQSLIRVFNYELKKNFQT
jgi:hypothetical protein